MATQLTLTATLPGLDGNLVEIDLNIVQDDSTVDVQIFIFDIQTIVQVTVGSADLTHLNVADWAAVAAAINAAASPTVSAVGSASNLVDGDYGAQQLLGGTQGNGLGSFYFAIGGPPERIVRIVVLLPIVLPRYFCMTCVKCGHKIVGSKEVYLYERRKV